MKAFKQRRHRRAGFTLIEILMVVVIIGILAALAAPRLSGRIQQTRITAAASDVERLGTALKLYELDVGEFPPTLQGLLSNPGNQQWNGPYLEKGMPKDPWGKDYLYTRPGQRNPHSYDLKSLGPDGVESADDIGNFAPAAGAGNPS